MRELIKIAAVNLMIMGLFACSLLGPKKMDRRVPPKQEATEAEENEPSGDQRPTDPGRDGEPPVPVGNVDCSSLKSRFVLTEIP